MTSELWSGSSDVNLRAAVSEEGAAHRKLCSVFFKRYSPLLLCLKMHFLASVETKAISWLYMSILMVLKEPILHLCLCPLSKNLTV